MRAVLLALALLLALAVPAGGAKGTAGTGRSPWAARLVAVPLADGRYAVEVDGKSETERWSWRGTATVCGAQVQYGGSGSATVRVYVDGRQIVVEVDSVGVAGVVWRGEIVGP